MQYTGTITTWNDERGFGWIAADEGGEPVFAHIKAFGARAARPHPGLRVSFNIALNPQGKKRAARFEPMRVRPSSRPATAPHNAPGQWGTASLFAIPSFLLLYLAVAVLWRVPPGWVAWLYVGARVLCFVAYALDKSAARKGAWRTSENTLLMLGLVGGWPGAIVAQQWLRHKSSKASFRSAFWGTVIVNATAFVVMHSPRASALLR